MPASPGRSESGGGSGSGGEATAGSRREGARRWLGWGRWLFNGAVGGSCLSLSLVVSPGARWSERERVCVCMYECVSMGNNDDSRYHLLQNLGQILNDKSLGHVVELLVWMAKWRRACLSLMADYCVLSWSVDDMDGLGAGVRGTCSSCRLARDLGWVGVSLESGMRAKQGVGEQSTICSRALGAVSQRRWRQHCALERF